MTNNQHPNLLLLQKFDIQNLDHCRDIVAENFVWHYINPKLPELQGDYHGLGALKDFFAKLAEMTTGTFKVNVVAAYAMGEELLVTQTRNEMTLDQTELQIDVVLVWRVVDNKIAEVWDIPSVSHEASSQQS